MTDANLWDYGPTGTWMADNGQGGTDSGYTSDISFVPDGTNYDNPQIAPKPGTSPSAPSSGGSNPFPYMLDPNWATLGDTATHSSANVTSAPFDLSLYNVNANPDAQNPLTKLLGLPGKGMDWLTSGALQKGLGGTAIAPALMAALGPLGALAGPFLMNFLMQHGDNAMLPNLAPTGDQSYGNTATDAGGTVTAPAGGGMVAAGGADFGPGGNMGADKINTPFWQWGQGIDPGFGNGLDFMKPDGGPGGTPKSMDFTAGPDGAFGLPPGMAGASGYTPFVPETMGLSDNVSKGFFDQAAAYESAAKQFDMAPLFAAVSNTFAKARSDLASNREKTMGDINAMFERNRISGSSLAAGSLASANAEFAKQEGDLANQEATATVQAKLQEIQTRSDYNVKATQARVSGAQAVVDNAIKVATLGAQNATIQAGLVDSANKLKGVLASIGEDMAKTHQQIAAQEAQSIRAAQTNIQISNTNAAVQQKTNAAQVAVEQSKIAADKNQGAGNLLATILAPALGGVGKGIAGSLFGTGPDANTLALSNLFGFAPGNSSTGLFGAGGNAFTGGSLFG